MSGPKTFPFVPHWISAEAWLALRYGGLGFRSAHTDFFAALRHRACDPTPCLRCSGPSTSFATPGWADVLPGSATPARTVCDEYRDPLRGWHRQAAQSARAGFFFFSRAFLRLHCGNSVEGMGEPYAKAAVGRRLPRTSASQARLHRR